MSKRAFTISVLLAVFFAPSLPVFGGPICPDQVPALTSNSSAVSTSGEFSSSYPAWEAFDAEISSNSMWISETWETPAWIQYDFGVNTYIDRYQITNSNGSLISRAPKDFKLQGWNGLWWATVDTRTNETGWISGVPCGYIVQSPGSYSKYRLTITDDNDVRSGIVVISISDLRLQNCSAGGGIG